MGLGSFIDEVGDAGGRLVDSAERAAGGLIEEGARKVADGLDHVGLHKAAQWTSHTGDRLADDLGAGRASCWCAGRARACCGRRRAG
jgi:hypothetical protein